MTPRQQRFVDEYLVDLNATQAAIRAGYSARTANEQGARLLANASIVEVVQAAQKARGERIRITQDDVMLGLHREATFSGHGSSHAARVSAWGLLGKHLGMFVDRNQQIGEEGQPVNPQQLTVQLVSYATLPDAQSIPAPRDQFPRDTVLDRDASAKRLSDGSRRDPLSWPELSGQL